MRFLGLYQYPDVTLIGIPAELFVNGRSSIILPKTKRRPNYIDREGGTNKLKLNSRYRFSGPAPVLAHDQLIPRLPGYC